mgnify:CR=1 FL=1
MTVTSSVIICPSWCLITSQNDTAPKPWLAPKGTKLKNHEVALTHTHATRVGGMLSPDDVEALVEYRFKSNTARETQDRKRRKSTEKKGHIADFL